MVQPDVPVSVHSLATRENYFLVPTRRMDWRIDGVARGGAALIWLTSADFDLWFMGAYDDVPRFYRALEFS